MLCKEKFCTRESVSGAFQNCNLPVMKLVHIDIQYHK